MGENSRIRIKIGPVEVEYEGTEKFLKDELLDMVKAVSELYRETGSILKDDDSGDGGGGSATSGTIKATTNQIATTLNVSSGPALITAAAAKLHFVDGKDTFTRTALNDEARKASRFYKENYRKNLSNILQSLVGNGTFNEPSDKTFALTDATIKLIGPKLAK